MVLDPRIWAGRRVLVTGHTGFKGAWLTHWLEGLGASVTGLALPPASADGAYTHLGTVATRSHIGDIRDPSVVGDVMAESRPSIVFHLAAEALVRRAYRAPASTFGTNVMGTVNILEAARSQDAVDAIVIVTSDKVYADASQTPAREDDPLGHDDPYSSSKACVELLVRSWRTSYFAARDVGLATVRAGNVIGGGDTAADRLIPDVLRADALGQAVVLRNPASIRPWQHVLDPLHGYLLFGQRLLAGELRGPHALNFGPTELGWTVRDVIDHVHRTLGRGRIDITTEPGPKEAPALLLNSDLAAATLGWRPLITTKEAIEWTVQWHRTQQEGGNLRELAERQTESLLQRANTSTPATRSRPPHSR